MKCLVTGRGAGAGYRQGCRCSSCIDWRHGYDARTRERRNQRLRTKYAQNPGPICLKNRLRRYGLTLDSYLALLIRAKKRCEICKVPFGQDFVIDHDASTGRTRGILCNFCNRGIGLLRHSPVTLQAAARYLEER